MYRLVSLLLLIACSASTWAERALLSGELGQWLEQKAIPELTDVLAKHPKFKGEPLRISSVKGDRPSGQGNALSEVIRHQLTHAVLRKGVNDVANRPASRSCPKPPRPVYYLVGIRIEAVGRNTHRVTLAVLDTAESVWVSGISLSWQGRLLSSERQALAEAKYHADPGTIENPIPLNDHSTLAQALTKQVKCRLPAGITGSVLTPPPSHDALQLVVRDLEAQLSLSALAMTSNETDASWKLETTLSAPDRNIQQINLHLVNRDGSSRQRLASVFVHGGAPGAMPGDSLLSGLTMAADASTCSTGSCAEVTFELLDEAYVVVFRTHQATVSPLQCRATLLKKAPGRQRYRISLADGSPQRTGLYVIASRDRQYLAALNRRLQNAPGACDTPAEGDTQQWLSATLAQIDSQQHAMQWRAIHLINTPTGPDIL